MRLLLALLLMAVPAALAQDVPQPRPRPEVPASEAPAQPGVPTPPAAQPEASQTVPLPRPPPQVLPVVPAGDDGDAGEEPAAEPQTPRVYQTACPAVLMGLVEAEPLPPLSEGACGEQSPLSVTGLLVNGRMLPLSSAITVNCEMAASLPGWAEDVEGFAVARSDTRLAGIMVGTSYMCRPRVSAAEELMSEHGFANGLDVVGFELEDGRTIDVTSAWAGSEEQGSRIIRFAHDAACTRFMTVLGPDANAEHSDHLHLDQGCHGSTCRARLCE